MPHSLRESEREREELKRRQRELAEREQNQQRRERALASEDLIDEDGRPMQPRLRRQPVRRYRLW